MNVKSTLMIPRPVVSVIETGTAIVTPDADVDVGMDNTGQIGVAVGVAVGVEVGVAVGVDVGVAVGVGVVGGPTVTVGLSKVGALVNVYT